ncbi:MAG: hypothetical protein NWE93_01110 [Candidatus Bathyarchaeota archaeon]|nr:hypothetical protein [Candidatus Bathyarchaeota archaeon]
MNKKTIYIIVAVLVVVIVVGVAGVMLLNNGGTPPEATPTPTPAPSIADAETLTFSANVTSQGQTTEYKWYGKDMQSDAVVRVDLATYAYILDTASEKSWISTDSGATWTASTYATDYAAWGGYWTEYTGKLAGWTSGDVSYENSAGEAIVLFNITIDPTIPDTTFATS